MDDTDYKILERINDLARDGRFIKLQFIVDKINNCGWIELKQDYLKQIKGGQ